MRGLKNAWILACKQDRINLESPSTLPNFFSIDVELRIPDGFKYSTNKFYTIKVETANKEYKFEYRDNNRSGGCSGSGCSGFGGCGGGD